MDTIPPVSGSLLRGIPHTPASGLAKRPRSDSPESNATAHPSPRGASTEHDTERTKPSPTGSKQGSPEYWVG